MHTREQLELELELVTWSSLSELLENSIADARIQTITEFVNDDSDKRITVDRPSFRTLEILKRKKLQVIKIPFDPVYSIKDENENLLFNTINIFGTVTFELAVEIILFKALLDIG